MAGAITDGETLDNGKVGTRSDPDAADGVRAYTWDRRVHGVFRPFADDVRDALSASRFQVHALRYVHAVRVAVVVHDFLGVVGARRHKDRPARLRLRERSGNRVERRGHRLAVAARCGRFVDVERLVLRRGQRRHGHRAKACAQQALHLFHLRFSVCLP